MATAALTLLAFSAVGGTLAAPVAKCPGQFTKISADTWLQRANPGWNLGNTLDALPTEGSWNNPPVQPSTFNQIQAAGFKGMRIPVTWNDHFTSGSPNWTVDSTWLQRVSDVVDLSLSRGFYTIVNVHHDSWNWADVTVAGANYSQIEERFYSLWVQIGTKLGCKSSMLAFEPINEPPGNTQADGDEINKLNSLFLKAIGAAGGFNKDRVVTLSGPGQDGTKTSQFFKRPTDITNPWAIQWHYYSPYDFIFSAWGKTIWGSDADQQALENDIAAVRGNFSDVPLVIGEWSAAGTTTETAARWRYSDFLVRTAKKYGMTTFWWDNGATDFDRAAGKFRDPVVPDIITEAAQGKTNSLADSTTDPSATSQSSSAFIYGKAGSAKSDLSATYILNGNTISSVRAPDGTTLRSGREITIASNTITWKAAYLGQYISSATPAGPVANFTISFSQGANLITTLVNQGPSKLGSNGSTASSPAADIVIPVTYGTQHQIAAVRAVLADGMCLFDTWTQYLGPLQQCYMTYSGQWDFDGASVTIRAAAVQAAIAAGQTTTFTVDFFPRQAGNSGNYTLTVA